MFGLGDGIQHFAVAAGFAAVLEAVIDSGQYLPVIPGNADECHFQGSVAEVVPAFGGLPVQRIFRERDNRQGERSRNGLRL